MAGKISGLFFIAGLTLIAYAILSGDANAGLFIIFPFIYGNSIFLMLGILFIFLSMFIFPFEFYRDNELYEDTNTFKDIGKRKIKGGGLIMIGPFPIIITNDKSMAKILIYIAVIMIAVFMAISIYYILISHP
ncbi:MAG: DUF131 domain-containing protein [Thermoplasmata archaeon]|nr:DUF131 domain-containing protein [Thermoplasmata archaeon]